MLSAGICSNKKPQIRRLVFLLVFLAMDHVPLFTYFPSSLAILSYPLLSLSSSANLDISTLFTPLFLKRNWPGSSFINLNFHLASLSFFFLSDSNLNQNNFFDLTLVFCFISNLFCYLTLLLRPLWASVYSALHSTLAYLYMPGQDIFMSAHNRWPGTCVWQVLATNRR